MNDPFNTKSVNRQLMREAKIGLAVVLLMASFFVYVGYFRMGRFQAQLPEHIVNAPVATNVGQAYYENFLPPEMPKQSIAKANRAKLDRKTTEPAQVAASQKAPTKQVNDKSPFLLPSAIMQVNKTLGEVLAEAKATGKSVDGSGTAGSMTPALPVADVTAGQGPIPADKLKSGNPNSQTEFDIAISGNDGKPEPFAASDLRNKPSQISLNPTASVGDEASLTPPDVRTAREVRVNDKVSLPAASPQLEPRVKEAGPAPIQPSPFDGSPVETGVAKTETVSQGPVASAAPAPFVPQAFTKPLPDASAAQAHGDTPVPDVNVELTSLASRGLSEGEGFEKHVVKSGDTYWSMAQSYLNDGRLFRALFEYNRSRLGAYEDLPAGSEVEIPPAEYLIQHYAKLIPADLKRVKSQIDSQQPGQWYVTQSQETLFDIAKEQYGQASRYLDILDANRGQLPENVAHMTRLPSGLRIFLPR